MLTSTVAHMTLALVGLALAVTAIAFWDQSPISGALGTLGGVLIIAGAFVEFLRDGNRRTTNH